MRVWGIFYIASVLGLHVPKLATDKDFRQWKLEVLDAVDDLEISRNGTSRNQAIEKIEKVVASFFVDAKPAVSCSACEVGIETGTKVARMDWTREHFVKAIQTACTKASKKPKSVCHGIAHSSGKSVYEILRRMDATKLTKPMACYAFGNLCPMPAIDLRRLPLPPKRYVHQPPKPQTRYKYILHLSDLHYDRFYEEGAEAKCDKPICCQQDSNSDVADKTIKQPAGKWGEYTCDANKLLLNSMLRKASSLYDYDMVFFTGDLPAHDMWKEAYDRTFGTEQQAYDIIKQHFPATTVYPVIGNHESIPVNQFPFQQMAPGASTCTTSWRSSGRAGWGPSSSRWSATSAITPSTTRRP